MRLARNPLIPLLAAVSLLMGCGSDEVDRPDAVADPGPLHVHGLGVNPRDGALFIATHTGLFRAAEDEQRATRVGGRFQDTMGFTVLGPDDFLGSGHPDGRDGLPPYLGLIRSRDAGRNWKPVSLLGKRDFHVLEASGSTVYGYGSDFETREAALLVSRDGGRTWRQRTTPEPLLSLAIDPSDPDSVVASGERGLHVSADAGRDWRAVAANPSLLSWPAPERALDAGRLYAVDLDGQARRSADAGRTWRRVGEIGGEPAAFEAATPNDLYAALHDGTIKQSVDGGATWTIRSAP